jgi:DnaK suppressor protein
VSSAQPIDVAAAIAADRATVHARIETLTAEYDGIVAATQDSATDDEHDPEGATIAFERQQLAALLEQAQQHLRDLDAAEERLAAGTFGVCEVCGQPISDARLEARPTARTCITCV